MSIRYSLEIIPVNKEARINELTAERVGLVFVEPGHCTFCDLPAPVAAFIFGTPLSTGFKSFCAFMCEECRSDDEEAMHMVTQLAEFAATYRGYLQ
jgi:hypothetical protein